MGVPSQSPPPPGSVGIGELYTDAQARTIWLGVPGSIDSAQAILIGDIVGLLQEDANVLSAAQSFAAAGLATKAPLIHTHTIAQISGLQTALTDIQQQVPIGVIMMWSGTIADIPDGYALCNGGNGTPDLREKFIMGAGGGPPTLSSGGSNTHTGNTGSSGTHTHTGTANDTVLTANQIPAHTHAIVDPGHIHAITDPGHTHTIDGSASTAAGAAILTRNSQTPGAVTTASRTTGITINSATTGISVGNNTTTGAGHSHALGIDVSGSHTHSFSVNVLPPYMVLAYIMKVA